MKRIHKTLLTAALVLGAGGSALAWMYFGDVAKKDERAEADAKAKRLFTFEPADVTGGVLHARGSTIAFVRDPSVGWRITSPVETVADATAIDAAIDRMATVEADVVDVGDVSAEVLAKFGLAERGPGAPKTWLEVSTKAGTEVLLVGPKNAIDGRHYVTTAARKTLWLADPAFYWSLDRNLDTLRDPRVFAVSQSQIARLSVSTPEGPVWTLERGPESADLSGGTPVPKDRIDAGARATKNEASGWIVRDARGDEQSADDSEVNFYLVLVSSRMKAENFLTDTLRPADEAALADYGLSPPELVFEVGLRDGTKLGSRFGWYQETASEKRTPVMWIEGTTTVVEVPTWVREDLGKSAAQLRERVISKFDAAHIRKMELSPRPGTTMTIVRDGVDGAWRLTDGRPAEAWRIEPLLRAASKLRAPKIDEEKPSAARRRELGFDPPRVRLAFFDERGAKVSELLLGASADDTHLYVMSSELQRVGRYAKRFAELVPQTVDDLVDARAPAPDAGP